MNRSDIIDEIKNMDDLDCDRLAEIYEAVTGCRPHPSATGYELYSELCSELDITG